MALDRPGGIATLSASDLERSIVELTSWPAEAGVPLQSADGHSLGDIDILAVDPEARIVLVVDTKARTPGVSPLEVGTELAELFAGDRSAVAKQTDRAAWVTEHLPLTLRWLGLGNDGRDTDGWTVEPLIVTDRPLVSTFLARPGVRT